MRIVILVLIGAIGLSSATDCRLGARCWYDKDCCDLLKCSNQKLYGNGRCEVDAACLPQSQMCFDRKDGCCSGLKCGEDWRCNPDRTCGKWGATCNKKKSKPCCTNLVCSSNSTCVSDLSCWNEGAVCQLNAGRECCEGYVCSHNILKTLKNSAKSRQCTKCKEEGGVCHMNADKNAQVCCDQYECRAHANRRSTEAAKTGRCVRRCIKQYGRCSSDLSVGSCCDPYKCKMGKSWYKWRKENGVCG